MLSLANPSLPPLDFSRHRGLIDPDVVARAHVACIGLGGAAGLVQALTRCGVQRWTLIDFDHVNGTNPTTQAHDYADAGRSKADALAGRIVRINPNAQVGTVTKHYQHLTTAERARLWNSDLVLAMTDHFETQCAINQDAIAARVDTVFAICYVGCEAVEITASFPDIIDAGYGCHRCHTKLRYDAYQTGFVNPTDIASHALVAEYLNALIGNLVLARLHQRAGVTMPIVELARAFAARPCLISRITPTFASAPGEAFAGLPHLPFSTSLWPLDTPQHWTCPDCGTPGAQIATTPEFQRPLANPGPGTIQERS